MWEDEVKFDTSDRNDDKDKKSIKQCERSDYIYSIHFKSGQISNFTLWTNINFDDAVRIYINKINLIIKLNLEITYKCH